MQKKSLYLELCVRFKHKLWIFATWIQCDFLLLLPLVVLLLSSNQFPSYGFGSVWNKGARFPIKWSNHWLWFTWTLNIMLFEHITYKYSPLLPYFFDASFRFAHFNLSFSIPTNMDSKMVSQNNKFSVISGPLNLLCQYFQSDWIRSEATVILV